MQANQGDRLAIHDNYPDVVGTGDRCRRIARRLLEASEKVGSCFGRRQEGAGKRRPRQLRCGVIPASPSPSLHDLQADLSANQRGIRSVVAKKTAQRIELVDERRGLIEEVVHAEVPLRAGKPTLTNLGAVPDVEIDSRPGINASRRDRTRILVGAGVVDGRQDRPAVVSPMPVGRQSAASGGCRRY